MVCGIALFKECFDLAVDLAQPVLKVCMPVGHNFEFGCYLFLAFHGPIVCKQSFGQVLQDFRCLHRACVRQPRRFEDIGQPHLDFTGGVEHLRYARP